MSTDRGRRVGPALAGPARPRAPLTLIYKLPLQPVALKLQEARVCPRVTSAPLSSASRGRPARRVALTFAFFGRIEREAPSKTHVISGMAALRLLVAVGAVATAHGALELDMGNWDGALAGKSAFVVIADVDCTASGKALCEKYGVQGCERRTAPCL
eukprot:scaffold34763_cov82-Phaeocystis_antarctica.AAC.3